MLYNYTKTSFKAIMIIFFGFYNLEFVRPSMTSKYVLNKFIPLSWRKPCPIIYFWERVMYSGTLLCHGERDQQFYYWFCQFLRFVIWILKLFSDSVSFFVFHYIKHVFKIFTKNRIYYYHYKGRGNLYLHRRKWRMWVLRFNYNYFSGLNMKSYVTGFEGAYQHKINQIQMISII